jgi:hypothetical protein
VNAELGSPLLKRKSRAYVATVAVDLTLLAVDVVHLVVAAAGVVACALGRTVIATRIDGGLASDARIRGWWCYSDRVGGWLIVLLDELLGCDLRALLLVAIEVELTAFAVLVVPLMEALAVRRAELARLSAVLSATVNSCLTAGTRRDRWSYDCDRAVSWLIILLDKIFRTGIDDCAVQFTLFSNLSEDGDRSRNGGIDSPSLLVTALRRLYASCSHMLG